ncbi:hypothetical protein CGRA01v4_11854 [Colletotrichum graminicola]|nr:hypothetical protein CGRA01v4_11854 [Colletotrichum graminicola]
MDGLLVGTQNRGISEENRGWFVSQWHAAFTRSCLNLIAIEWPSCGLHFHGAGRCVFRDPPLPIIGPPGPTEPQCSASGLPPRPK